MDELGHWILNDDHSLTGVDLMTWAKWLEENRARKIVKQETVGEYWISTVFLGLNHNYGPSGPPLLFETMVFDKERDKPGGWTEHYCDRYSTWDEAMAGHAHIVAYVTACGRPPGNEV